MNEPRVVYAVCRGSAFETSVECLFEAREDAIAYATLDSDLRIEEFMLYWPGARPPRLEAF